MDKARLRQKPLRRRLVVGIGVRREVLLDLDPLAAFHATAGMDREALQVQEDLDLVLGKLDSQRFVTMDVRCTVVIALHGEVAIGM